MLDGYATDGESMSISNYCPQGCGRVTGGGTCLPCWDRDATRLGKPRYSLLPWRALVEVVAVLEHGATKHGAHGWRDKRETEYRDKALRHLAARMRGEVTDAESGRPHLACAIADLLIALELGAA
jgi:hypothetical protein